MKLHGEDIRLHASGAAFLCAARALVVADLHLEKASAFAGRGFNLPPLDTLATLDALAAAIEELQPRLVICLGDSFHDAEAGLRLNGEDVTRLHRLTASHDWLWVEGNHDPDPPDFLGGRVVSEIAIGNLTLRHEPSPGLVQGEIAGHLHPKAAVRVRGRRVEGRCFASDGQRMILPSFGAFTGGLNLRHAAFAGLFAEPLHAHIIGGRGVRSVPGDRLV